MTEPRRRPPDLLPLLVLGSVAGLLLVGYKLFPLIQHAVWYQQCIASGRITGC